MMANNFFPDTLPWDAMLASSLFAPGNPAPSQTATDMMVKGRPSYNWAALGALAPLTGWVPQPEYRTAPPSYVLSDYFNTGPYALSDGNIVRAESLPTEGGPLEPGGVPVASPK